MLIPDIPSVRFDNRTDFDALHFDTIDQHGVAFHVIAAKTGYRLGACDGAGHAALIALDDPAPLNGEDQHHDDDLECSVRQESDLAPYKPLCDVVVIGSGHAPRGQAARSFNVSLRVQLPDQAAQLPQRPYPLNPMQALSPAAYDDWQAALSLASRSVVPGAVLIDKTLAVTGERTLRRYPAPLRWLLSAAKLCTLGLAKPSPWRLSAPGATLAVPIRYELAQGGQCRVESGGPAAGRVPAKHRLSKEELAQHPDQASAPVAHDASHDNPTGRGFTRRWYLDAERVKRQAAPCIEYPAEPFTAARYWRATMGKATLHPAGFGFVGRAWLPRRTLIGKVETKATWGPDEVPGLPREFDFRYWNGAPNDQQCPLLEGGERFTLTNLCRHDAPYAHLDANGNTALSFTLPQQALFVLGTDDAGAVAVLPLSIDTVLIDLDAGQVDLVWRLCLLADGELTDVRLMHANTPEQLERLAQFGAPAEENAAAPASHPVPASSS